MWVGIPKDSRREEDRTVPRQKYIFVGCFNQGKGSGKIY